jgi:hypothetical protein
LVSLKNVPLVSVPVFDVVTVTVQTVPTAGVIAADQTICYSGDPAAFTSTTNGTGSSTISYIWQSSTNNSTWSTIASQTGATYDVPSGLTTSTYYKRYTVSTLNLVACQSVDATTAVLVTVQSTPTAGSIGTAQTICSGGDPAAFTSGTDGTGAGTISYIWQLSTDNATWTLINGANSSKYDAPSGLKV